MNCTATTVGEKWSAIKPCVHNPAAYYSFGPETLIRVAMSDLPTDLEVMGLLTGLLVCNVPDMSEFSCSANNAIIPQTIDRYTTFLRFAV